LDIDNPYISIDRRVKVLDEVSFETEERMEDAVVATIREMSHVRTGRANPAILDRVIVEAYGQSMALKQLATVATPDAHTLLIKPFDRNTLSDIEKAINKSGIGLTPANDGNNIRLNVPPLTSERRQELAKVVKNIAEEGRVSIRNARRDANDRIKKLEKQKEITEDDVRQGNDEIQKLTDNYIERIDEAAKKKEEEITTMR
jgi:ribosome recycling factor